MTSEKVWFYKDSVKGTPGTLKRLAYELFYCVPELVGLSIQADSENFVVEFETRPQEVGSRSREVCNDAYKVAIVVMRDLWRSPHPPLLRVRPMSKRPHTSPNCDCAGCVEHDAARMREVQRGLKRPLGMSEESTNGEEGVLKALGLGPEGKARHEAELGSAAKTLRDLERVLEAAKKATGA